MSCTTPDDPGLTFSTRNALPPFSTTERATSASMMTLLVTLSSPLRKYVPGARIMRPTAVSASALVRATVLLTTAVPGGYGGGGGEGGENGGRGGDGGGGGGGEEKMRTSARLRIRPVPGSTMVTWVPLRSLWQSNVNGPAVAGTI